MDPVDITKPSRKPLMPLPQESRSASSNTVPLFGSVELRMRWTSQSVPWQNASASTYVCRMVQMVLVRAWSVNDLKFINAGTLRWQLMPESVKPKGSPLLLKPRLFTHKARVQLLE